jgi:hypothetical protein
MNKLQELHDSIFTGDIAIDKKNLPVLAVVCIFSLLGAMYFGMFFARPEVLAQSSKRQHSMVESFASIAAEKDGQIRTLTNTLNIVETTNRTKLTAIEDMTTEIAMFLSTATGPLDEARVERLRERIMRIQAEAKSASDGEGQ